MSLASALAWALAAYILTGMSMGMAVYDLLRGIETGDDAIARADLRQSLHQTDTTIARLALKAAIRWPHLVWNVIKERT